MPREILTKPISYNSNKLAHFNKAQYQASMVSRPYISYHFFIYQFFLKQALADFFLEWDYINYVNYLIFLLNFIVFY